MTTLVVALLLLLVVVCSEVDAKELDVVVGARARATRRLVPTLALGPALRSAPSRAVTKSEPGWAGWHWEDATAVAVASPIFAWAPMTPDATTPTLGAVGAVAAAAVAAWSTHRRIADSGLGCVHHECDGSSPQERKAGRTLQRAPLE